MHCTACGNALEPSARFCGACGHATPASAAIPPPPPALPAPAPAPAPVPARHLAARPVFVEPSPARRVLVDGGPDRTLVPPGPRRQLHWARIGAIAAAFVVSAMVGVVAFNAFHGNGGGAGSPESAVKDLAAAMSKEDAPSAMTLFPPGEVRSMKGVISKATSKASNAGLVRASNPFGGIDLNITGLRLEVQKPAKDVAKVTVQAGTLSYVVDEKAAQTPVQSKIAEAREHADDRDAANWGKHQVDLGPGRDRTTLVVMTVRQHGRWYVSPAYTVLERWRQENGLPNANFTVDLSKVATGSKTPEGAFNDAAAAVQSFDISRAIDLLSPDELGGAARRYRQAILVGTGDYFADLKSDASFRINESHPVVQNKHGGSAEVALASASGSASSDREVSRWTLEGTCLTVISSEDRDNNCLAEFDAESGIAGLADAVPNFFVSVTSFHGQWYISPVQTVLRYLQLLVDRLTDRQTLALVNMRQFAKPDGAITAGTPLTGTLAKGQYGVYSFNVDTAGPILACSNDDHSNVGAYLYRPNGRPADELTDGIYFADQGSNRVVVRPYSSNEPGNFDVSMKPIAFQDVALPGDASGSVGRTCDGKILRFNASAGDHILIQGKLQSSRPTVYDTKGDYVASGRIFTPRDSGTYLLVITDAGDYSVHIERATGTFLVQYGTIQGSVPRSGVTEYQLYAAAGDRFRISVVGSSGFDGKMDLVNPAGTIISSADDTNGRDPAISYQFSTEGIYRVRVSGYQGQAGSFSISVN